MAFTLVHLTLIRHLLFAVPCAPGHDLDILSNAVSRRVDTELAFEKNSPEVYTYEIGLRITTLRISRPQTPKPPTNGLTRVSAFREAFTLEEDIVSHVQCLALRHLIYMELL